MESAQRWNHGFECHSIMSSFFGCFLYAYMLSKDVLQSAHANVPAKCCEKLVLMHMEDKMVEKLLLGEFIEFLMCSRED